MHEVGRNVQGKSLKSCVLSEATTYLKNYGRTFYVGMGQVQHDRLYSLSVDMSISDTLRG